MQDAALEKVAAGEGRNVEHVALADEHVPEPTKPGRQGRKRPAVHSAHVHIDRDDDDPSMQHGISAPQQRHISRSSARMRSQPEQAIVVDGPGAGQARAMRRR